MDASFRKTAFFILCMLVLAFPLAAQQSDLHLSGSVLDASDLNPLRGAIIKNTSSKQSATTNEEGFFRIEVKPGDTLQIQHKLYRQSQYLVPGNLKRSQYALIQLMQQDSPRQASNRPYFPTQQQFEESLLEMDRVSLVNRSTALANHLQEITYDPTNMQKYLDQQAPHYYLYEMPVNHTGVPNNLLNPERWINFIRDWREGRFTPRAVEKLEGYPGEMENQE